MQHDNETDMPQEDTDRRFNPNEEDIDSDPSADICRICYCGGGDEELMRPCKCSGSLAFVHPSCLDSWIENSGSPKCEICNANYPLTVNYKWWYIWNDIWVKFIVRQEPLFVFLSAMVNIMSSVMFRPVFLVNQLQQVTSTLHILIP
ncbi:E3 ubiquitin-protein ligase MARCH8-like isoform X2 [Cimex lectularius]|uniref:RING-CH-type domain-containing protein n=1 Tax=Cimex lectularius TaxID=79782 RepID=A0A8I6SQA0_CIMLE|nr:E3 ubiquitin-protein ligase MARCH8-like isoform X2 [Cimex lectularius]